MPIFQIRKCWSRGDGTSNFCHLADVIAEHARDALIAAQNGLVRNWRFDDQFDRSDEAVELHIFMGEIQPRLAQNPSAPTGKRPAFFVQIDRNARSDAEDRLTGELSDVPNRYLLPRTPLAVPCKEFPSC